MKNEYLPLADRALEIPKRKWYEQEEYREIFVAVPLETVRERLISNLQVGSIGKKSFWSRLTRCSGRLTGNSIHLTLTIPTGRGDLNYDVFGELTGYSNGCLIQATIRDTNSAMIIIGVAVLVLVVIFNAGIGVGIFAAMFFGGFAFLALSLQHSFGVNGVAKAINNLTDEPFISS